MEAAAAAPAPTSLLSSSTSSSSSSSSSSSYSLRPKFTSISVQNSPWNSHYSLGKCRGLVKFIPQKSSLFVSFRTSALAAVGEILEKSSDAPSSRDSSSSFPKLDKSGRFCSPRAARELALSLIYAACLEGSDPIQMFEKRINGSKEIGYVFDKECLMEYNHMSFGGPPVTAKTVEEADELLRIDAKASENEAEVLSAPPKLVYSQLILRFARKLLVAVVEKWDTNALVIENIAPANWKDEPAGRILEFSILHLAMSEITVLGTRHQIVINEAVDLAKRFCDGAAPRVVNGCLRTFVKDREGTSPVHEVEPKLPTSAADL